MKKIITMILIALLALSTTAFATIYRHYDDITFEYDDTLFEISMDDHTDDEDLVILTGKEAAWGNICATSTLASNSRQRTSSPRLPTLKSPRATGTATRTCSCTRSRMRTEPATASSSLPLRMMTARSRTS